MFGQRFWFMYSSILFFSVSYTCLLVPSIMSELIVTVQLISCADNEQRTNSRKPDTIYLNLIRSIILPFNFHFSPFTFQSLCDRHDVAGLLIKPDLR